MSNLEKVIPYLDEIMSLFYKDMLSHKHLADFFESDSDIESLIEKQKANFVDSLNDTQAQLKTRYLRLGELHYDLRVPSADFLKSTKIWRGCFIQYAINKIKNIDLVHDIESYFTNVDSLMSKGYLRKQIEVDKIDLEKLIRQYQKNGITSSDMALEHLSWLYQILIAIQAKNVDLAPELDIDKCTIHNSLLEQSNELFSKDHFDDLHQRLHIDAKSIFYFIEINDYIEVLSLYSSLLIIYKVTLIALGNIDLQQKITALKYNLSEANNKIKQLRGIIPICSYCHNIRNDEGAWTRLEKYISEHSEANFSHGICPKCLVKAKAENGIG